MADGDYRVYIDWDGNDDFAGVYDDVTGDVLDDRSPVTTQFGRDQQRALSPIAAGQGAFTLNNLSRRYSPENTASPLDGLVVPARSVLVTGEVSGVTYTMLRAVLDDFKVNPNLDQRSVDVDLIDALGQLRGNSVSTGLYQGLRPGEAAAVLLDAVGWPADLRDLESGATVMPFWYLDGEDAFDALMDLVASEGPPALVTVDADGKIVFRGRHHRLQDTASTDVQSTWRSSGVEPLISSPADYNHGWKEIVNSVTFQLPQLALSGTPTQVFTSQGQQSIAAGDSIAITAQGSSPFANAIVPEAGTDFTQVSGTVTVTLSRTSGPSVTIFVQAGLAGPAVIADLSLRAFSADTVSTIQVSADDPSSIEEFRRRSLPDVRSPKWASIGDAKAIAGIILAHRADRLPTITVSMVSANTTRLTQQLTRDLSDRVHIVEEHTGLDADCYLEQIAHTITQGGAEHRTTFGCEKVPAQIADVFILGDGLLGTNKLGKRGFADPSTMFVLDTQGVLGTNVLVP